MQQDPTCGGFRRSPDQAAWRKKQAPKWNVTVCLWSALGTIWFGANHLAAQAPLGGAALAGAVRDEQSLVVAGAKLRLTDKAKGLVRESVSGPDGSFLFPSVSTGIYRFEATKDGFSTHVVDDLRISVGDRAVLEIRLTVGEVRTVVTVAASDRARLDSESNAIGDVVDSETVRNLPLNGRNFLQLALVTGGALQVSPASDAISATIGNPARTILLPGTLPYSVAYTLNGISVRGSRVGELSLNVSIAAIDEFKVQEGFLTPDQGPDAAVVNVVTKSGGSNFHGEVFEFFRDGSMDARGFFAPSPEALKRNQFGLAVGGPVRKNRLWFHAFYEGLRESTAFASSGYSPTAAMFRGNLSETGRTIYDPASYSSAADARQPFPGSTIPSGRINPVASNLSNCYLPGSSLASMPGNVFGNPLNTADDDQGGGRIDLSLTPRQQAFGQFFHQNAPVVRKQLYPYTGLLYDSQADVAMLQHAWSVSPRLLNSLRLAFSRIAATGGNEAQTGGPILSQLGITNAFDDRGITAINLAGYSAFGRSNGVVGNYDNEWRAEEEVSYKRLSHSYKFGISLMYRRGWHLNANTSALGQLRFDPAFSAQLARNPQGQLAPLAGTGDAWADFLLGMPTSGTMSGLPTVPYRGTQAHAFLQDTWTITRDLTLNYGLSWFVQTPPDPRGWARGAFHGFDRTTGLLTYSALGELDPKGFLTDWNNLAPRLGLAWKPAFLQDTLIRASAGIYYSDFPWILSQFGLSVSPPFGSAAGFTNPQNEPLPIFELGKNIFPARPAATVDRDYAASLPQGTIASSLDPAMRTSYVGQWTFSVQRILGAAHSAELAYIGSSGHQIPNLTDISQCRPGADLSCNPAAKPWPRYNVLIWQSGDGNSSYEGVVARYRRRTARGLTVQASYAFSKTLTDAWQSSLQPHGQIATCRRCDKGPASFDVRQRAVGGMVWDLPYGRGRRHGAGLSRAADLALGGWTLNAIVTFASGQPLYLRAPNRTGGLYLNQAPNRVCDGRSSELSGNVKRNGFLWFDPACFPIPALGHFGNSGRSVVNGPGLNNWDLGLEKTFALKARESTRVLFRAEMFNAWNHTQFQAPNADAGAGVNFGRISSSRPPRLMQLGIKLLW